MKTEHLGLRVTEVPGIEKITVEPSKGSDGGVHVVVKFAGFNPLDYGIDELGELIEALTTARTHAQFMREQNGREPL
jgi:hypothetical protein